MLLLHKDVNPISHCRGGKETGTQSHWLQGGFASWYNARNKLKLLITGGRNWFPTQILHSFLQNFFLLQNEGAVPSAMLSTLPLIYWKRANTRGGIGLPSPPTHTQAAAARLKSLHYRGCSQPRTPCWTRLHTGAAVREMWCRMAWIQLDSSHKQDQGGTQLIPPPRALQKCSGKSNKAWS